VKAKTVAVEMPEDAFYLEGIQLAKRGIALDIQKFLPEIATVTFTETFKAESKKTETKEPESKKEEKPEADKEEKTDAKT
jgi:hypothetical protein